jgi:hypothetical protein
MSANSFHHNTIDHLSVKTNALQQDDIENFMFLLALVKAAKSLIWEDL